MRLRIAAALLVIGPFIGLAACDGEDPVDSVVRDVSTANHAAAAAAEAEAAARKPAPAPTPAASPAAAECDVEVTFGSFCCGVDGRLQEQILAVTRADPDVTASTRKPWGREGESTLCVTLKDDAAADRFYGTVAALLPSTSIQAPTTVRHRDGRSRATAYPTTR